MGDDPQVDPNLAVNSCLGTALYFDSGEHRLFGWLHQPLTRNTTNLGLVICSPFGYEAMCSHSNLRAFAEAAAERGVPALRFDYRGTGDSADIDPKVDQFDAWTEDVNAAINELQRRTQVERVCLFGIRLGALIATAAAARCSSVASLMLVAPVINGRRYIRELRMVRMAAQFGAVPGNSFKDSLSDPSLSIDNSIEVSGYPLSGSTIAALSKVDLTTSGAPPVRELVIIDDDRQLTSREWAESQGSCGHQTRYLSLPGLSAMLITSPHLATISQALIAALQDWLSSLEPVNSPQSAADRERVRDDGSAATANVLKLPGDEHAPDSTLTERPVIFGDSDTKLFGIATEPREGEGRHRGVILLNAGADWHIGANRLYVSLARQWARHGYYVLRMDLSGIGESGRRHGRPANEVFSPLALEDIRAAIEFMRGQYEVNDITLGGLCSGAYHSLRAAVAMLPVNRILLVNPENFFWREGTRLDELQLADVVRNPSVYRERIFSAAAWKKLLSGEVNIWRVAKVYIKRVLMTLESRFRDLSRRLRIRLSQDLGWELENLAARGIHVTFIFARGEPGIDLLKLQAGSSIKRLSEYCRVRIVDDADHTFSRSRDRKNLERILSEELFVRSRSYMPLAGSNSRLAAPIAGQVHGRRRYQIDAVIRPDPMHDQTHTPGSIGVVVIGRNEGERLTRCLESACSGASGVVYVDSGSQDNSVEMSRARGVSVVELDLHIPFTAARARNAGFERLLITHPGLAYVFFVDGDCEVVSGWLAAAGRFLDLHPDVAVVCGRRREKHPEKSLYNLLTDMEWEMPVGETFACGGDAMARVDAIEQVNGYRPDLICGEEAELCARIRRVGWKIWRLDEEMTLHDAALYRFSQWWKRMVRGGYAFALDADLYGAPPERLFVQEVHRVWFWTLCIPVLTLAWILAIGAWGAAVLLVYPFQILRLFLRGKRSMRENWWRAIALLVCKFPEMLGVVKFMLDRQRHVQSPIIEYK